MKIYFTAAISQKDAYAQHYEAIVKQLESLGHTVIHRHITQVQMTDINQTSEEQQENYYTQVLRWISEADVVIAEVSFPSTVNVGYEVSLALERGKSVIGLYTHGKLSKFFTGIRSEKFVYSEYSLKKLADTLRESLDYTQDNKDTRFNFLVPPDINEYLDWIAKNRRIPRAVYLRRLIETDRAHSRNYQK